MQNNLLRKCGLLAHTSPAFLKNCWIKKLLFACGSWLETLLLGKPLESGSVRLGHILVQFYLLRKCGLLAHTSPAFLKNCCTEKLFSCLQLVSYNLFFSITKKHLFTKMLSDDSRFHYACSSRFNPNFFAANAASISTVPSNPRQAVFITKSRNSRLSTGYPVYFK